MKSSIFIFLFVSILLFVSCAPSTKDSYLNQYKQFIQQVKDDREKLDFNWAKTDKKFEQFSQVYYQRFEKQLSVSEKIIIKKYWLEYNFMRFKDDHGITQEIESILKEVNEMSITTLEKLKQMVQTAKEKGSSIMP